MTREHINIATTKAILVGTPLVGVTVYRDVAGLVAVDVRFLHGEEAAF